MLQVDVAHAALHVSILARPEGRALHPRHLRQRRRSRRFNPRPARRPSAAHTRRSDGNTRGEVSILARPEGRALPGARRGDARRGRCFNPRPARRPSAALCRVCSIPVVIIVSIPARPEGRALHDFRRSLRAADRFQSPPGPKAERCMTSAAACEPRTGFNPRPARRPSAAAHSVGTDGAAPHVSILARPEGRTLQRRGPVGRSATRRVSILARPEGRALHTCARVRPHVSNTVSILARPEGRALHSPGAVSGHLQIVSILARPEGRALPTRRGWPPPTSSCFNPRPARRPSAARPGVG